MPQWLRNLVMLVVLGAWLAVVAVTLIRGSIPDAAVLGIPAAVVLALAPPALTRVGRRGRTRSGNTLPNDDTEDSP